MAGDGDLVTMECL